MDSQNPKVGIVMGSDSDWPLVKKACDTLDSSGVPVATVACGSAGPVNAALLAVQILGTADADLREKFRAHKETLRAKVAKANERIHQAE